MKQIEQKAGGLKKRVRDRKRSVAKRVIAHALRHCEHLTTMADRVRDVVRQTKARIFKGLTKLPGKVVSLFEPHTEIIRKGKAGKPNEFGKLVQLQEAGNQIITHYEVFEERPSDQHLLRRGRSALPKTGPRAALRGSRRRLLFPSQ